MLKLTLLLCLLAAAIAVAQNKPAAPTPDNPYTTFNKMAYGHVKDLVLRSAEKMPEEKYNFKPVDTVRSFGQIIGHVADSQYYFCSVALGDKNPAPKIEQTKTSKADLIAALKESDAYCDKAFEGMTDALGAQPVKIMDRDMPRLAALTINNMHGMEHYGNLVTYMRMKSIVPPSSEQSQQPPAKK
jgi:uncharacterized damage-inducible protein DinB